MSATTTWDGVERRGSTREEQEAWSEARRARHRAYLRERNDEVTQAFDRQHREDEASRHRRELL